MNIIITVDENWAIGSRDKEIVKIPAHQRKLQSLSMGKTIVMGKNALQAMPQGQPLYGRENIILSAEPGFKVKGARIADSVPSLLKILEGRSTQDIYICGGDSTYRQLFDYCNTAYVTMVEKAYETDCYFVNLDNESDWNLAEESEEQTYFDITYYFRRYERVLQN